MVLHFVLRICKKSVGVEVRTEEVCTSRGVDNNVLEECYAYIMIIDFFVSLIISRTKCVNFIASRLGQMMMRV